MALIDTLTQDMKAAMKARDKEKLAAIRLVLSNLKNIIKDKGDINEQQEIAFLSTEAKKRRESIDAYTKAGRDELAAKEKQELDVISEYLPKPINAEALNEAIERLWRRTGRKAAVQERAPGNLIAVFSPKGGSGSTTLAVNLAVQMNRLTRDRTLILDLDL